MSRRRDSDRPPPAHPADALRAFDGGSGIDPYQGGLLERPTWTDDDTDEDAADLDDEDDEHELDAAGLLEAVRARGPRRWLPICPSAFPCNVDEASCRHRLPAGELRCSLALAEAGGLTLEQVGAALGVSKERARQLELCALQRVRVELERVDPDAFQDEPELEDEFFDVLDDEPDELEAYEVGASNEVAKSDTAPPPPAAKLDSRSSLATLRGILARHGAISTTAPAMSTGAGLRELASLSRQLRAAVSRKGAR